MLKMHHTAVDALLDAEIEQIVALKRMAANPRLVDLMRQIVAATENKDAAAAVRNGNQQALPGIDEKNGDTRNSLPNGLTQATWQAVCSIGRPFTIPDVVECLDKSGFRFVASKPKVAVAAPIKAFLKRGRIRLTKRGIGSEPNTYELVSDEKSEPL